MPVNNISLFVRPIRSPPTFVLWRIVWSGFFVYFYPFPAGFTFCCGPPLFFFFPKVQLSQGRSELQVKAVILERHHSHQSPCIHTMPVQGATRPAAFSLSMRDSEVSPWKFSLMSPVYRLHCWQMVPQICTFQSGEMQLQNPHAQVCLLGIFLLVI